MHKFYVIFRQSISALLANKGRSFLTTLGIIIGIGAVIALISLGAGLQEEIGGRISTLGATNLVVTPGAGPAQGGMGGVQQNGGPSGPGGHGPGGGGPGLSDRMASTLTEDDFKALSDSALHPLIKQLSANVAGSTVLKVGEDEQRYVVNGTSPEYFGIRSLTVAQGSLYDKNDIDQHFQVSVLGAQLATDLFGDVDPLGATVQIQGEAYRVTAVLAQAEESGLTNYNLQMFIPNTSARETFKATNYSSFIVQAVDEDSVDDLKEDIENTIMANHKITNPKAADITVNSAGDLLSTVTSITSILTSVLAGLAAISLLVGGIGIMNIMLVSVTERTREIGLRKAVGAKTFDILNQFIIEAVLLTLAGGILGIGFGVLIGRVASHMIGFSPVITGWSVLLAGGVSGAIGLIFGVFPASKAARLNPIDALRYE